MIVNHLDVYEVEEDYARELLEVDRLRKLAFHPNFSPRLIEFVTTAENYLQQVAADYYDYVIIQLDSPHEVWQHAYSEQLNDYDRFMLQTLYSFGRALNVDHLKYAFERRVQYEIQENNMPRKYQAFDISFKTLMDSFIVFADYYNGKKIEFINPSVEDFLNAHIANQPEEINRIIDSVYYVEQVIHRFRAGGSEYIRARPSNYLFQSLKSHGLITVQELRPKNLSAFLDLYNCLITWMFFRDNNGRKVAAKYLAKVDWDNLAEFNYFHLLDFIRIVCMEQMFNKIIVNRFCDIIRCLIYAVPDHTHLHDIRQLFDFYNVSFKDYIDQEENGDFIFERIHSLFQKDIEEEIERLLDNATRISEVDYARKALDSQIQDSLRVFELPDSAELSVFDDHHWDLICHENVARIMAATESYRS